MQAPCLTGQFYCGKVFSFVSILEGLYLHRESHRQLPTAQENQGTRKNQTAAALAQGSSLLLLRFVSSVKNKWGRCSVASAC